MKEFELRTEYIELSQLLKAANIAPSGGIAGKMITDGLVKVDGALETRKGRKLRAGQRVECAGETVLVKAMKGAGAP